MKKPGTSTAKIAASGGPDALLQNYTKLPNSYDEYLDNYQKNISHKNTIDLLKLITRDQLLSLHLEAQKLLSDQGVIFRVYDNNQASDHVFPLDLLPRSIDNVEWVLIDKGLRQRVYALNEFLRDVYGHQHVLNDNIIPREIVESSAGYMPILRGMRPPGGVYLHISGIDIVRNDRGELLVLEDNLRVPSGISYALTNRNIMKKLFANIFSHLPIREIENYPQKLHQSLTSIKETSLSGTHMVLLSPGPFNSAYFEHKFLAHHLNCDLVLGEDLFVRNDVVYQKKGNREHRIDIIYRRIDDVYLDPRVFNKDSLLGVAGLFGAYAKGNVMLANALGNGVADDKSIFPYVPKLIRYYLKEEPLIDQVQTYSCIDKEQQKYVLANLRSLVVKLVDQSGGYGMVMGPEASEKELAKLRHAIITSARSYIAQPLIELSSAPTLDVARKLISPRRLDLRPYCLMGSEQWIIPGGLTRVALKEGSYVVNSSQGGGSKDTWVLK